MYDFWYQPRQNALISSEWASPNTFLDGFNPADVAAGKYGRRLHFWDLEKRAKVQTIDLGDEGLDPVGDPLAARSGLGPGVRRRDACRATSSISIATTGAGRWTRRSTWLTRSLQGWPLEGGVPGLITDLVLSLDDKDLFFSNWLHGDVRHYDVSDPTNPQLQLTGVAGRAARAATAVIRRRGDALNGGPQMIQNSLDGDRVYVTNSLFSTWDNQFYPGIEGWLVKLERQPDGTYRARPGLLRGLPRAGRGARPHEIHLPGGDCTTEIFQ